MSKPKIAPPAYAFKAIDAASAVINKILFMHFHDIIIKTEVNFYDIIEHR